MAKHNHDKESHFIPSPFRVVTSYENAFIKAWNDNLASAVADVLKYTAKATADAIKNGVDLQKAVDDDINKAHNVGDVHPNGRWVWTEYAPGKYDWRSKKKSNTKSIADPWEIRPEVKNLKSAKECCDWLVKSGAVTRFSDISIVETEAAKAICSVIYNLHVRFKSKPIKVVAAKLKPGISMQANGGMIEINAQLFKNFDPKRYYKKSHEDYVKQYTDNIDILKSKIKRREGQLQEDGIDQSRINYLNAKIAKYKDSIKTYQEKIDTCPCWTNEYQDSVAADIAMHEFGHVLNAQCSGGCGFFRVNGGKRTAQYNKMAKVLNDKRNEVFNQYIKDKKYLSEYSTTKPAEFFAESFVAYVHKDKRLPKYVKDFFDDYFSKTEPLI